MLEQPLSASLILTNAKHDKVFRAWLMPQGTGWVVRTEWGARSAGKLSSQVKPDSPTTYEAAKKIYDKKIREKTELPCSCGCGDRYLQTRVEAGEPKLQPIDCTAAQAEQEQKAEAVAGPTSWAPQLLEPIEGERGKLLLVGDDRYGAQEKYDGVCISLWWAEEQRARCFNKLGQLRDVPTYVADSLIARAREAEAKSFWVHGELLPNGGPLVVHDLMEWNGDDQRGETYRARFGLVATFLGNCLHIAIPELITGTHAKSAFVAALAAKRAEGVVFKRLNAPYLPGRTQHFKFKFWQSATCKVTPKRKIDGKNSHAISVLRKGKLVEVGTVTGKSSVPAQVGSLVEVKYLYVGHGDRFVQPELLGLRDDQARPDDWSTLKLKDTHREARSC